MIITTLWNALSSKEHKESVRHFWSGIEVIVYACIIGGGRILFPETLGVESVYILLALFVLGFDYLHISTLDDRIEELSKRPKQSECLNFEDKGSNIAYMNVKEEIGVGEIAHSIKIEDTGVVLDFDKDYTLLGVESIEASRDLPEELWTEIKDGDNR